MAGSLVSGVPKELVPAGSRDSLAAWLTLYMQLEAAAGSANSFLAKQRDMEAFLSFFRDLTRSDHPDQWTRSVSSAFLRHLEKQGKKPTTINRVLASLRHAASWLNRLRPFLAGHPFDRIGDLQLDDPEWKGLSDLEVTRLRSAAEQLLKLKTRENQQPLRDYAVFLVLLNTGLRVSELLALGLDQYQGKHFLDVKRKGRKVSRSVFVPKEAREALDRYLDEIRGRAAGPLFCSGPGRKLSRQYVDDSLKEIAAQANAQLPPAERIALSAHVLRHTFLRRVTQQHGVEYAMEVSGHTSSQYIWRYVRPSDEQRDQALETLF